MLAHKLVLVISSGDGEIDHLSSLSLFFSLFGETLNTTSNSLICGFPNKHN